MMGNYLVRFLGGDGGESPPTYPIPIIWDSNIAIRLGNRSIRAQRRPRFIREIIPCAGVVYKLQLSRERL
jgi:hypothetical protein